MNRPRSEAVGIHPALPWSWIIDMLKSTAASLLLGLLLLLAVVSTIHLIDAPDASPATLSWDSDQVVAINGSLVSAEAGMEVTLDENGRAILALPMSATRADDYAHFDLSLPGEPSEGAISLFWQTREGGDKLQSFDLPPGYRDSVFLSTGELDGWSGEIMEMAVLLSGRAGESVSIDRIALRPDSLSAKFTSTLFAWRMFLPWRHTSVNTHQGITLNRDAPGPVLLAAGLMLFSVAGYALLSRAGLFSSGFEWRVVGAIALVCWLALDLLWQGRLLRQVESTYRLFAGMSTQEQLRVGFDAALVDFTGQISREAGGRGARIFVSSASDYLGMRGAYYLYPNNVYWRRKGSELPRRKFLRPGDLIAVIKPTKTSFDPLANTLALRSRRPLPVERLLTHDVGSLYRVK